MHGEVIAVRIAVVLKHGDNGRCIFGSSGKIIARVVVCVAKKYLYRE